MRAIHFKCGRDDGLNLNNLHFDRASGTSRSGKWDVSEEDARALIGGWIYLHPNKATLSEWGGTILGFEPVIDDTFARSARIVFIVQKQPSGAGQKWRGKAHGMAHSSGAVDANLPHEKKRPDAARS